MNMKKNSLGMVLFASAVLAGLSVPVTSHADEWTANTPDQIQITTGQSSYAFKKGDTIWSTVEKLKSLGYKTTVAEFAELNNVDLAKGEQRTIPIGRTFNISKDTLTVKEADGEVVSQTVQKDKPDPVENTEQENKKSETTKESEPTANTSDKTETSASSVDGANSSNINNSTSEKEASQGTSESSTTEADTGTSTNNSQSTSNDANESTSTSSSDQSQTGSSDETDSSTSPSKPEQPTNVVLGVPFISQGNTMLCEGTSLLEALHYKGVATNQDLMTFVKSMPLSPDNNPNNGFSGEWRHNVDGTYQGMNPAPVVSWGVANGGNVVDISGSSVQGLKDEIVNGNPVVAWVTYAFEPAQHKSMFWGDAIWNRHVVAVDGFKDGFYHVVDPVFGASWINAGSFETAYNVSQLAVSVR
ncbi:C39 family peptidase [Enterococcus hirae]|uniref:C39 family peptidase n=1 Tax=Enterococcus hirae TaxID=1354 RepID=UPI002DB62297|nr:C39 family peptidase [Enterococcus hirae]